MRFANRKQAGRLLADRLQHYMGQAAVVVGLPRGGVVVASEIARQLQLPLQILCPKKLGAPTNQELALGAVTETGDYFLNEDLIRQLGVSLQEVEKELQQAKEAAKKRFFSLKKELPPRDFNNKLVILVDDGLATGATMKASIKTARREKAQKVVVAVPVASIEAYWQVKALVDEVICLHIPPFFGAVGEFYQDFAQVEEQEVLELLQARKKE